MNDKKKIIGTLLPLFSLQQPNFDYAQDFLDWLKKTNQSAWLLLPLHETQLEQGSKTKHVPSPYKSYGIGLDPRYLSPSSLRGGTTKSSLEPSRGSQRFARNDENRDEFIRKHKDWIYDYSLFCALRDYFGTDDWSTWDDSICSYNPEAVEDWSKKLAKQRDFSIHLQWQLHESYSGFYKKANELGISLIGDLSYYPSYRSPLVWAHQKAFQLNKNGSPANVSGIPNTQGAHFGRQVWGHPLYNWETEKQEVVALWKMRLKYLATIFDIIRFDHTKAFFEYGVMDIHNPQNDTFQKGPGKEVLEELVTYSQQNGLTIFAEDSGDRVKNLRIALNDMNIPGLRIFRFSQKKDELHMYYADIKNYPENCVASTTTHDTETLLSYIQTLTLKQKKRLGEITEITYTNDKEFSANVRDAVIASNASIVIIPIQDWLLTTDRINIPGTEKEINDTNWQYKLDIPIEELPDILTNY